MASEQSMQKPAENQANGKSAQFALEREKNAGIRKRLSFLILGLIAIILLGFFIYFLPETSDSGIHASPKSIHFTGKPGQQPEIQLKITNDALHDANVEISVENIQSLVKADSESFTLGPKQSKTINFAFSSFDDETKKEIKPGIYAGKVVAKSGLEILEVPVVLEIETRDLQVDLIVEPVYSSDGDVTREIKNEEGIAKVAHKDSFLWLSLKMFSLGSQESSQVENFYYILDMKGNALQVETETLVFDSQALFLKSTVIGDLAPGRYVYGAQANFGNYVSTSSFVFEVVPREFATEPISSCMGSVLCTGSSVLVLVLAFMLLLYFYFFIASLSYEDSSKAETMMERVPEEKIQLSEAKLPESPELSYKRFALLLQGSGKCISSGQLQEAKMLYTQAREVYMGLDYREKTKAYPLLADLYERLAR